MGLTATSYMWRVLTGDRDIGLPGSINAAKKITRIVKKMNTLKELQDGSCSDYQYNRDF
jgi:hypothetical protein